MALNRYYIATTPNPSDPIGIYGAGRLPPGAIILCDIPIAAVPTPKTYKLFKLKDGGPQDLLKMGEFASILRKIRGLEADPAALDKRLDVFFDPTQRVVRFGRHKGPAQAPNVKGANEILLDLSHLSPSGTDTEYKLYVVSQVRRRSGQPTPAPASGAGTGSTNRSIGPVYTGHQHTGRPPVTSWAGVFAGIPSLHKTKHQREESKTMTDHGEMLMLVPATEGAGKIEDVKAVAPKAWAKTHIAVLGYREGEQKKIVSVQNEYQLALDARDHDPREGVISPQVVMQYILPNLPTGVRLLVNPDTGMFRFLPVTEKFSLQQELTFEPRKTNMADFSLFLQKSAQGEGRQTAFFAQCEEDYLRPPKNFATRVWREALGNPKLPTTGSARRWLGESSPGAHISLAL